MTDPQTPPTEAGFFTTIRGWNITRSDSRVFSGVASGLAEKLGWSIGWTRAGVVGLAILLNGLVLLAYAAAWALLPDRQGRIIIQDFGRGVPNVGALIGIGIFALLGLINLGDNRSPWNGWPWDMTGWPWDSGFASDGIFRVVGVALAVLIPLAIIAGVIVLIVVLARRGRADAGGQYAAGPHGPTGPDGAPPVYAAPPAWAAERQRQRAAQWEAAGRQANEAVATAERKVEDAMGAAERAIDDAAARAEAAAGAAAWSTTPPPPGAAPTPPPAYYAAPPAPPVPPRTPRVPGPGAPFGLLTLAWLVISAAGTAWATWRDWLVVHPLVAWFALFVTGLGVILALVSLAGRKLGFLGFLSAMLLIPTAVMIIEAEEIRDGWADHYFPEIRIERDGEEVTGIDIGDGDIVIGEPVPESSTAVPAPGPTLDALAVFADDYAQVTLPAWCDAADEAPSTEGTTRALLSLTDATSDTRVTLDAQHTVLRVAAGTGVTVDVDGAMGEIYWPSRGVWCELGSDSFSVANPDSPSITLASTAADEYYTIVIEEVQP